MRILLVINLKSGQGDSGIYEYIRALGEAGAEVSIRFLGLGGSLDHLLRDADAHDRVVAAGGDGTVSGVCMELANTGIPVLAYPAGTANLFALNLGMPTDPLKLAEVTLGDTTRDIDVGEITWAGDRRPTGFTVAAGAGYDATIMEAADRYKRALGPGAYLVAAVQNIAPTVARFRIELDDRTIEVEGMAVLVMNVARIQFDISITHESNPADGLLEVVVIRTKYVPELIPAVWNALLERFTSMPERPGLEVHTARRIRIESDPPLPIQYDGEVAPERTPLTARVLPGAARMLVPGTTAVRTP